jgi:uncharacterized protein (DUF2164 family)
MKKHYNKIELAKEQKLQIAGKLEKYLRENYETDIGVLKSELFIDFISKISHLAIIIKLFLIL